MLHLIHTSHYNRKYGIKHRQKTRSNSPTALRIAPRKHPPTTVTNYRIAPSTYTCTPLPSRPQSPTRDRQQNLIWNSHSGLACDTQRSLLRYYQRNVALCHQQVQVRNNQRDAGQKNISSNLLRHIRKNEEIKCFPSWFSYKSEGDTVEPSHHIPTEIKRQCWKSKDKYKDCSAENSIIYNEIENFKRSCTT